VYLRANCGRYHWMTAALRGLLVAGVALSSQLMFTAATSLGSAAGRQQAFSVATSSALTVATSSAVFATAAASSVTLAAPLQMGRWEAWRLGTLAS